VIVVEMLEERLLPGLVMMVVGVVFRGVSRLFLSLEGRLLVVRREMVGEVMLVNRLGMMIGMLGIHMLILIIMADGRGIKRVEGMIMLDGEQVRREGITRIMLILVVDGGQVKREEKRLVDGEEVKKQGIIRILRTLAADGIVISKVLEMVMVDGEEVRMLGLIRILLILDGVIINRVVEMVEVDGMQTKLEGTTRIMLIPAGVTIINKTPTTMVTGTLEISQLLCGLLRGW